MGDNSSFIAHGQAFSWSVADGIIRVAMEAGDDSNRLNVTTTREFPLEGANPQLMAHLLAGWILKDIEKGKS